MKKTFKTVLGVIAAGVLLVTLAYATPVGRLVGDSLYIEATPRTATPDVTVGADDAYIQGTLEVDGASRFDGAVTANGGITGTVTGASSLNVLKAGDTMTGTLAAPRISLTYGVSAATAAFTGAISYATGSVSALVNPVQGPCTTGQYAFGSSGIYLCVGSAWKIGGGTEGSFWTTY